MSVTLSKRWFWGQFHDGLSGASDTFAHMGASAKISLYTGSRPAAVEIGNALSAGATLLGTATIPNGNFSTPTDGVSKLISSFGANASATGTASWARFFVFSGSDLDMIDVDVSTIGGGGDLIIDSLSLTSGLPFSIESCALYLPASLGTVKMSIALVNALVARLVSNASPTRIGRADASGADLFIYTGSPPANPADAATGTLLLQLSMSFTSFWSVANTTSGEAALNPSAVISGTTVAAGDPGYFRMVKNSYILQGTCGVSGTDMIVDKGTVTSSETLTVTEATLLAA